VLTIIVRFFFFLNFFFLLLLSGSSTGSGTGRSSSRGTSRGNGSEFRGTLSDEFVDVLAVQFGDELLEALLIGGDTTRRASESADCEKESRESAERNSLDRSEELGNISSRRRGVSTGDEEEVGGDVLHLLGERRGDEVSSKVQNNLSCYLEPLDPSTVPTEPSIP